MNAMRLLIASNEVGRIVQHVWKGDGRQEGKDENTCRERQISLQTFTLNKPD